MLFCECGALLSLPLLTSQPIVCARCAQTVVNPTFTTHTATKVYHHATTTAAEAVTGALIKATCPNCGAPEMAYATAQIRSADEGQTVFYTCVKCGHRETVNS